MSYLDKHHVINLSVIPKIIQIIYNFQDICKYQQGPIARFNHIGGPGEGFFFFFCSILNYIRYKVIYNIYLVLILEFNELKIK